MPSQNWEREKAGVKALGCAGTMLGRDFPPSVEPASCQEKLIVGGGVGIWVRETFFPTGEHVWRGGKLVFNPSLPGTHRGTRFPFARSLWRCGDGDSSPGSYKCTKDHSKYCHLNAPGKLLPGKERQEDTASVTVQSLGIL